MSAKKPSVCPVLPYRPQDPEKISPGIALIGCGGITKHHLQAYLKAEYRVVALCDIDLKRAEERRDSFYPEALATTDLEAVLADPNVQVVDITTHPPQRPPLIEAALKAGKHVLSQKPYVLDLETGAKLADIAKQEGVLLAVNQNARWSPHFSYLREAVAQGLLGDIHGAHFNVHWDHSWVAGTPFDEVYHLMLYDFAIHWFDLLGLVMQGQKAKRVTASIAKTPSQSAKPPLMGQAMVEYENAQATLVFDGHSPAGDWATYAVVGSDALLRAEGFGDNDHQAIFMTPDGEFRPKLEGQWFDDGFHGAMGELLCAIEQERQPTNSARQNLDGLALCFAAVASAESGKPVDVGSVNEMPANEIPADKP